MFVCALYAGNNIFPVLAGHEAVHHYPFDFPSLFGLDVAFLWRYDAAVVAPASTSA